MYDASGRDVAGAVGPLFEGDNIVLTCEVRGGKWTCHFKALTKYCGLQIPHRRRNSYHVTSWLVAPKTSSDVKDIRRVKPTTKTSKLSGKWSGGTFSTHLTCRHMRCRKSFKNSLKMFTGLWIYGQKKTIYIWIYFNTYRFKIKNIYVFTYILKNSCHLAKKTVL